MRKKKRTVVNVQASGDTPAADLLTERDILFVCFELLLASTGHHFGHLS